MDGRAAARVRAWLGRTLRPWRVVLVALLLYTGAVLTAGGGDPLAFATLGARFSDLDPLGNEGYDGQFVYYVARDLVGAAAHLDVPAYRFQRILYPLLARLLALGNVRAIPWTLIALNIAAHTVGTALVERLLIDLNTSRWYALTYGLWAGLIHAVRLDLHEPLSYALLAAALLAHLRGRRGSAALFFALAVFAKETALVFVLAYLVWALFARAWRSLAATGLAVMLPLAAWQWWLYRTFGAIGLGSGGALATPFEVIPFMGIARIAGADLRAFFVFALFLIPPYVVPSIAGIVASARAFVAGDRSLWMWLLGANAALIPFTPFSTFREPWAMLRFGTGLVLAWLLFAAQRGSTVTLRRTTYWIFALAFLIRS